MIHNRKTDLSGNTLEAHALDLAYREWGPPRCALPRPRHPAWHIVLAEPQRERVARRWLKDFGVAADDLYLPLVSVSVAQNYNRRRKVERAMFPGYVFLRCDPAVDDIGHLFRAPGVAGMLRMTAAAGGGPGLAGGLGHEYAALPDLAIHAIRLTEAAEADYVPPPPEVVIAPGDLAEITADEWRGHFGRVLTLDEQGRAELLMVLFGAEVRVRIAGHKLRAAAGRDSTAGANQPIGAKRPVRA